MLLCVKHVNNSRFMYALLAHLGSMLDMKRSECYCFFFQHISLQTLIMSV